MNGFYTLRTFRGGMSHLSTHPWCVSMFMCLCVCMSTMCVCPCERATSEDRDRHTGCLPKYFHLLFFPRPLYVDQAGLHLMDLPAPATQVLKVKGVHHHTQPISDKVFH